MEIDEFLKVVRKRRSIRQFKPDPIPDEYIEKILEAARWAMSGANGQPWEFIVVKDGKTRNKIVDFCEDYRKQSWQIERTRISEFRHPAYIDGPAGRPLFGDAPVFIVVLGDLRTYQASILTPHFLMGEGGPQGTYLKNMGNATQNLHLAAAALGLGAQWVSVSYSFEGRLKALLGVPEELTIHTIVPIGYPAHKPAPPYRRKLAEIVHYEKYDQSKHRSGEDIYEFLRELRQRTKPAYPG